MASANVGSMSDGHTKTVEQLYYEAYALVDQGICYDEIGRRDGALAMYERGLRLIDEAGRLPGADQSEMYQKMARAREHILFRLKDLRSGLPDGAGVQSPSGAPPRPPPPYESISNALNAFGNTKNAEALLEIPDGVQIFFMNGEDTTAPSYPTNLKIFKFLKSDGQSAAPNAAGVNAPPAFLQVGDWIYPLVPGRSPVLHSTYGAYIFPNPSVDTPDAYVGVMFPPELERAVVEQFEKYMNEFTVLRQQEVQPDLTPREKEQLSTKIAKYLIAGGEFIASGIKSGAEKGLTTISKHSQSVRTKTPKTEKPIAVDPRVQSSVHYLRQGTKVAVKISGYLVDRVGELATHLGKSLAKSAQKRFPKGTASGNVVNSVIEVTGGGVAGFSTIWMSLEDASRVLAKGIANETVQVVDHKYGESAAAVTGDLLHSAGYSAATAMYVESLGIKGIAKRTAKHAGIAILKDLNKPSATDPATPAGDTQVQPSPTSSRSSSKK